MMKISNTEVGANTQPGITEQEQRGIRFPTGREVWASVGDNFGGVTIDVVGTIYLGPALAQTGRTFERGDRDFRSEVAKTNVALTDDMHLVLISRTVSVIVGQTRVIDPEPEE